MTPTGSKPAFIPGLSLAESFYQEVVEPILTSNFPGLQYSAALIGSGSEVLGFDTEMSTDHTWGPRMMLFLTTDDFGAKRESIRSIFCEQLPNTYRGYSTNFSEPGLNDNGMQMLRPIDPGLVNHCIETFTISGFFNSYLGVDISKEPDIIDWLTLPQQKLRSIVAGKVFHDSLGLENARKRFSWYPQDAWLFIMASIWERIGQEEHLMGRAGTAGDDVGSTIIAARLVRDIMRLVLLMEKEYPPYAKWLGTAFYRSGSAKTIGPVLEKVLRAKSWQERDNYLSAAYSMVAEMHNDLGITPSLPTAVTRFFGRPFTVIKGDNYKAAILDSIKDPQITSLLKRSPIGSIDVFSDNSDLLEDPAFRPAIRILYEWMQR
jgi:hypothetical protein